MTNSTVDVVEPLKADVIPACEVVVTVLQEASNHPASLKDTMHAIAKQ